MGLTIVTGANRGIGLELARQLKDRGAAVVAICRNRSIELDGLGIRVESGFDLTAPATWPTIGHLFRTRQHRPRDPECRHSVHRVEGQLRTRGSARTVRDERRCPAIFDARAGTSTEAWRQGRLDLQPHGLNW